MFYGHSLYSIRILLGVRRLSDDTGWWGATPDGPSDDNFWAQGPHGLIISNFCPLARTLCSDRRGAACITPEESAMSIMRG